MSTIGKVQCPACVFDRANVNEGKNGTLSINCPECGALTLVKSPKAVNALRERLGTPAPAKTGNQSDLKDLGL